MIIERNRECLPTLEEKYKAGLGQTDNFTLFVDPILSSRKLKIKIRPGTSPLGEQCSITLHSK
jgi:hypothetical protein